MVDFDFNFVEDTFSANEEPTVRRVCTPNDSGSAINFNAQIWGFIESSKKPRISSEDGVFGVFDVEVFCHETSISAGGTKKGRQCATPSIGSCQQVTAHEFVSLPAGLSTKVTNPAANVPFPILLEDALPGIGESRAQGV